MGTYKVIQDIEAEDTIIGWMTPRQAIYAAIVIVSGGLWFMFANAGAWWLGFILLPHMILFLVLSGPFVHDQPSEVWLLAKIKFFLQPRKRIWDQSGLKELVTVTVPKRVERQLTDGLSQGEVKSRLHALANTLDSRGWAVKNVNVNMFAQPGYAAVGTDRLLGTDALPQEVPSFDVSAQDDILDEANNPRAQQLEQMISQSTQAHRQQLMQQMQASGQKSKQQPNIPADYWFMNANAGQQAQAAPGYATFQPPTVVNQSSPQSMPTPAVSQADEAALLEKLHTTKSHKPRTNNHLRTILPVAEQQRIDQQKKEAEAKMIPKPINQQLAQNNDRSVESLAREAKKSDDDGEVVISLH